MLSVEPVNLLAMLQMQSFANVTGLTNLPDWMIILSAQVAYQRAPCLSEEVLQDATWVLNGHGAVHLHLVIMGNRPRFYWDSRQA
jgi:hypothetical protein